MLNYTPSIIHYHSSIPVLESSSSSELDESPDDSTDDGEDAAGVVKHHVQLRAR